MWPSHEEDTLLFLPVCRVCTKPSIRRRGAPPLAGGHRVVVAWRLQLLAIPLVGPPCGRSTAGSAAAFSWERGAVDSHGFALLQPDNTGPRGPWRWPVGEVHSRSRSIGLREERRTDGGVPVVAGHNSQASCSMGCCSTIPCRGDSMDWRFVLKEGCGRPSSSWSPALGDYYKRDGAVDRLPRLGLASSFSTLRIRVVEVWAPYPTDGLNLLCKFTNMNFYMMTQVIADVRHWLCFSFSFSPGAAALSSPCLLCSCWEHFIVDYSTCMAD